MTHGQIFFHAAGVQYDYHSVDLASHGGLYKYDGQFKVDWVSCCCREHLYGSWIARSGLPMTRGRSTVERFL